MVTPAAEDEATFVLTVPTVAAALADLRTQKVHTFFIAYLHLRERAAAAGSTTAVPDWRLLRDLLLVQGGPPGKPLYRPMWHENIRDPGRYWLKDHLTGSYSPSSVRQGPASEVVIGQGRNRDARFVLRDGHAALARTHLLYGERLPALSLGAFLLRDFGFLSAGTPDLGAVTKGLASLFRFTQDDPDFDELFTDAVPDAFASPYFEPWSPPGCRRRRGSAMTVPTALTAGPVRRLDADAMGIGGLAAIEEHGSNRPDEGSLADDDPRLLEVVQLLRFYGGVILSGPPGTSKSWYAAKIATKLTDGDRGRYRFVQFHPSYQYEDFMQGFVPRKDGTGFELLPKYFVQMCQDALDDDEGRLHVLVIDELSRGDAGRIFGEALTYVEKSKRGLPFRLASGDECVVPDNLAIIATMNPLDRGVDEVDAAFERRFAKVAMDPDRDLLRGLLERNGVDEQLLRRIVGFFDRMSGMARTNPHAAVGHTFFADVRDLDSAEAVWKYQLRFLVEKAYRLDPAAREEIEAAWAKVVTAPLLEGESGAGDGEATPQQGSAEEPVAEPPPVIDGGQP